MLESEAKDANRRMTINLNDGDDDSHFEMLSHFVSLFFLFATRNYGMSHAHSLQETQQTRRICCACGLFGKGGTIRRLSGAVSVSVGGHLADDENEE